MFDYLLFKLNEHGIGPWLLRCIWMGKKGCLSNPEAFAAQENYLAQFVAHGTPHIGVADRDDLDILGCEIVNEAVHFKRPDLVTGYLDRMVAAIRRAGCEKPLFNNMTTSASQIDSIFAAKIQGGTFQWDPTGLTTHHDQKGNLLPMWIDRLFRSPMSCTLRSLCVSSVRR